MLRRQSPVVVAEAVRPTKPKIFTEQEKINVCGGRKKRLEKIGRAHV